MNAFYQKNKLLLWGLVFFLAVFLRTYHIDRQSLILFDEGAQILRAQTFKAFVFHQTEAVIPYYYVDTKAAWIFLLLLVQIFVGDAVYYANLLSALFGLLSISVTYFLARRLFKSEAVAFLSAGFLAISPLHVYLSRLAIPETMNMLFSVLALYFYLRATEKGQPRVLAAAAGICLSIAFLANILRVAFVPVFFILIELYMFTQRKEQYRKDFFRFLLFIISFILAAYAAAEYIYGIYRWQGLKIIPYLNGLDIYWKMGAVYLRSNFLSSVIYLLIIGRTEGYLFYALGVSSLFFVRKKPYALLLIFAMIAAHILGFSLIPEKGNRLLSTIAPLFSVLYAAAVFNFYSLARGRIKKALFFILIALICWSGIKQSWRIAQFQSDFKAAAEMIGKLDPDSHILTTNMADVQVYVPSKKVEHIFGISLGDLRKYYTEGYRYILTDPLRYGVVSIDRKTINAIEAGCRPLKCFDHFEKDAMLREFYILTSVSDLASIIDALKREGRADMSLSLYEVKPCLERIENRQDRAY